MGRQIRFRRGQVSLCTSTAVSRSRVRLGRAKKDAFVATDEAQAGGADNPGSVGSEPASAAVHIAGAPVSLPQASSPAMPHIDASVEAHRQPASSASPD